MSDELHFMMGKFKAVVPVDRGYSPRHMWLRPMSGHNYRVGLTAYSVRLLQDVYFLEWSVDQGTVVADRQEIGEIESSKAVSSLYAPFSGRITGFNDVVLNDPSAINTDNYGDGWLFDFETQVAVISPEDYLELLDEGWEKTQQTIKGQLN